MTELQTERTLLKDEHKVEAPETEVGRCQFNRASDRRFASRKNNCAARQIVRFEYLDRPIDDFPAYSPNPNRDQSQRNCLSYTRHQSHL